MRGIEFFLNKNISPQLNNKHLYVGAKIMELTQNLDTWGMGGILKIIQQL